MASCGPAILCLGYEEVFRCDGLGASSGGARRSGPAVSMAPRVARAGDAAGAERERDAGGAQWAHRQWHGEWPQWSVGQEIKDQETFHVEWPRAFGAQAGQGRLARAG